MAEKIDQLTQVARERADKKLDAAIGDLHKAATEIGKKHGIPEGIAGHSIDDLLGRIAYIPSMARELRRAAAQTLASLEIGQALESPAKRREESAPAPVKPIDLATLGSIMPSGKDLGDLKGLTVQTVKALKGAGLHQVGDVVNVPDEHLLKVPGIQAKQVAQLRQAIVRAAAEAAQPGAPAAT